MNDISTSRRTSVRGPTSMKCRRMAALGCILAIAMPLAVSTNAQGATETGGCTVSPLRPFATGRVSKNNIPIVQSRIQVDCITDRTVKVQHQLWDEDSGDDQNSGPTEQSKHLYRAGKHAIWFERPVGPLDDDNTNEMYQRVRFYTCSVEDVPVCTAKTEWEASTPPREIHVP
jgi:hypothetical protein